jgi:hypothetical protein
MPFSTIKMHSKSSLLVSGTVTSLAGQDLPCPGLNLGLTLQGRPLPAVVMERPTNFDPESTAEPAFELTVLFGPHSPPLCVGL